MSEHTSRSYVRFPLARRIEHIVMLSSFTILGLTGLPQKFSTSPLSIAFVGLLGGIENLRLIHHTAAIVMMLGTIWHILFFGYMAFVVRTRLSMLPSLQDVKDGWQAFMYNLGFAKSSRRWDVIPSKKKWSTGHLCGARSSWGRPAS